MKVLSDITNRQDLELLVKSFYKKALTDKTVGYIFTAIAKIDLDSHIPRIVDFWEGTILGSGSYTGNTMAKHLQLSEKEKLVPEHFNAWLKLWEETVNDLFTGKNASEAVNRAKFIAKLMMTRIGN